MLKKTKKLNPKAVSIWKSRKKRSRQVKPTLNSLELRLNYSFQNSALLKQALTHPSFPQKPDNQRLEFLGDAALNFALASMLAACYPSHSEGALTRMRAHLCNANMLEKAARCVNLQDHLLTAPHLSGCATHGMLGDACEAVLGAVYLDGGFEALMQVVNVWFKPFLISMESLLTKRDPKTQLQELCQAYQLRLPCYTLMTLTGAPPHQIFTTTCRVDYKNQKLLFKAEGSSKKISEQRAAQMLLKNLKTFISSSESFCD